MLRYAFIGLVLAVGCVAPVGSTISVPPDAAQTCSRHCQSIGMRLSAVAIMANNVGCVCQMPSGAPAALRGPDAAATPAGEVHDTASEESATAAAGMATVLMQEAEQQQQRANQARPNFH